ncbi:hypothetical protein GCM10009737_09420 [Nocardioides lentus]|uniref:Alpha/beta hydrolase n=1 Tax=Nocardioides lentus TaxID=338077 RepID=A0ABN2P2C1_9ACTN
MSRTVRALASSALLLASLGLAGCSSGTGETVDLADGEALVWGDGPQGVVLAHGASYDAASWEDQAVALADAGATVVAIEDLSAEAVGAAVQRLRQVDGVEQVTLVGASAGADTVLGAVAEQPRLADQLVLLSPTDAVSDLPDQPKLFVASQGDPVAAASDEMAATSSGDDNELLLLPGDAHAQAIFETDQGDRVLDAITERVEDGV